MAIHAPCLCHWRRDHSNKSRRKNSEVSNRNLPEEELLDLDPFRPCGGQDRERPERQGKVRNRVHLHRCRCTSSHAGRTLHQPAHQRIRSIPEHIDLSSDQVSINQLIRVSVSSAESVDLRSPQTRRSRQVTARKGGNGITIPTDASVRRGHTPEARTDRTGKPRGSADRGSLESSGPQARRTMST